MVHFYPVLRFPSPGRELSHWDASDVFLVSQYSCSCVVESLPSLAHLGTGTTDAQGCPCSLLLGSMLAPSEPELLTAFCLVSSSVLKAPGWEAHGESSPVGD